MKLKLESKICDIAIFLLFGFCSPLIFARYLNYDGGYLYVSSFCYIVACFTKLFIIRNNSYGLSVAKAGLILLASALLAKYDVVKIDMIIPKEILFSGYIWLLLLLVLSRVRLANIYAITKKQTGLLVAGFVAASLVGNVIIALGLIIIFAFIYDIYLAVKNIGKSLSLKLAKNFQTRKRLFSLVEFYTDILLVAFLIFIFNYYLLFFLLNHEVYYDLSNASEFLLTLLIAYVAMTLTGSFIASFILLLSLCTALHARLYFLGSSFTKEDLLVTKELISSIGNSEAILGSLCVIILLSIIIYLSSRKYIAHRLIGLLVIVSLYLSVSSYSEILQDKISKLKSYNAPWNSMQEVKNNGQILTFADNVLSTGFYGQQEMNRNLELGKYPDFDFRSFDSKKIKRRPNINIITLESFVDPNLFVDSDGKSLKFEKQIFSGLLSSLYQKNTSKVFSMDFGTGTPRAEFEILCGIPSYWQNSKPIFFNYITNEKLSCLPRYLKQVGYKSIASNVITDDYFNEKNAYLAAGFDKFYSKKDFKLDDMDGIWISDESIFQQNLEFVRRNIGKKPLLNYLVTSSGHYPFELDNPKRPKFDIVKQDIPERIENIILLAYYNLKALERYIKELQKIDPDTIIIVMADHQPPLTYDEQKFLRNASDQHKKLYSNKLQSFSLFIHGKELFYNKHTEMFNVANILVDYLSQSEFCNDGQCLDEKPFMIRKPIYSRLAPEKTICDSAETESCIEALSYFTLYEKMLVKLFDSK